MALGAFLLVIGAAFSQGLLRDHRATGAQEGERLQADAKVIDENLIRQLEGANRALEGVGADVGSPPGSNGWVAMSRKLKLLSDAMPGARSMRILDVNGAVVASSIEGEIGRELGDREYFNTPRRHPDPATLYVSPPFKSSSATFSVVLSRVLTGRNGEFSGVVTAALDPDYFKVVLRSVLYSPDMRTMLIHGDGKVFLNMPENEKWLGSNLAVPGSHFSAHRQSGRSSSLVTGAVLAKGGDRMIAMQTIDRSDLRIDRPLVASVSRDLGAIYQPWREKALRYGVAFVLLSLGSGLALCFSQRRQRALARIAESAANDRQISADRIELALRGANLGLWDLHISSGSLVVNEREREMLGYAADEELSQGKRWRALVHPDDWSAVDAAIEPHLRGQTPSYECEHRIRHKDRRWVWVYTRATVVERDASGAPIRMIGTHLDISARKHSEGELARSAEMLRRSEERMSVALHGSGLALFDWDIGANRVYQSAHAAAMRGERAAEATLSTAEVRSHVHPDDLDAMLARMQHVLSGAVPRYHAEYRIRRVSGDWIWIRARGNVIERDSRGRAMRLAGTYADITERKVTEQQLRHLAEFDPLTDLPNRTLFYDRLQQAMVRAARSKPMALLFLDIDHFKTVNDTLGHEAGDQLLKVFATRMRACVRQSDTVARLAGDEFTIILEGLHEVEDARLKATELVETLRAPIALAGKVFEITVSIGIAMCTPGEADDAALMRRADAALYEAKRRGRNGFHFDEISSPAGIFPTQDKRYQVVTH
jgi:diguanylate cyclase (GGDEF)-like protein/PAS domain S-box-containing protein